MTKSTTDAEDLPPPYNYNGYSQQPVPPAAFQEGPGNMPTGSAGGNYTENAESQTPSAPPAYSQGSEDFNCFSDAAVRRGFIRKVYLTLMVQLLVTTAIICAFLYWPELRVWTIQSTWFTYTMLAIVFALIMTLSCCGNLRRKVPLNFILLGLFTVAEGLMLGSVAVFYEAEAVLWAVGATAFVSFALSAFAMQTKWEFTTLSGSLWALGWSLVTFGILCAILRSQYLYIVYASLGTLLFSVYLVMDTQFMLGGKHRYSISPEEYIFVALNLYLDIVSLFLFILQLIGLSR